MAQIYYFSATGNSLVVARDISAKLEGQLTAIPSVIDQETIRTKSDVVGIVFPAYYMTIPGIVQRFINKLRCLEKKYVFAVVTVGGIAGPVLERTAEMVTWNGGKLAGGFVVRMPANYIHDGDSLPVWLQNRMFRKWSKKVDSIADYVAQKKDGRLEKFNPVMTTLFRGFLEKKVREGEMSADIDTNFWVDDKCKGCGTCVKVCPVGNIQLVEGKPVWQHQCEKCLACIQWCPQTAIQYGKVTSKRKRYHHPEVTLTDFVH